MASDTRRALCDRCIVFSRVPEFLSTQSKDKKITTVGLIAGMIPTAPALSEGGGFRQPMSITVIGGSIMSTALMVMIIPALFSLAVGIEAPLGPKLGNRLTTGGEHAPATGSA